jgi:hypothetical protein
MDAPAKLGFVENGFKDPAGCGWRDDRVTDTLHFHLWSGNAGKFAPCAEVDRHGIDM